MPARSIARGLIALVLTSCAAPLVSAAPGLASSFARPHPSVVRISVVERAGMSLGSGGELVAVNQRLGLVVTCWHVVQDAAGPIVVSFPDGFRSAATVVRTDRGGTGRTGDSPAGRAAGCDFGPSPAAGRNVGAGRLRRQRRLSRHGGPLHAISCPGEIGRWNWSTSMPRHQGDSGGPIFNGRGELAGVLSGSGFGQTCGSYCGRVRWFLGVADADFRRVSSQGVPAQQRRRRPRRSSDSRRASSGGGGAGSCRRPWRRGGQPRPARPP